MKLYENGTDIFQVLEAIEKHTGLFLLNRNLDYLYSFIAGYKLLAAETKTEIKNLEKLDQFSLFLKEEFNEAHENTMGWFGQLHSAFDPIEGFEKFYEYLHKFRSEI
jgi:flagellin-specific chaperone FliS